MTEWPVRFPTQTIAITNFEPDPDIFRLLFGAEPKPAIERVVIISRKVPGDPWKPVKNDRLRGKRYRQARRAYRRALTRWKKAGKPDREIRDYFPRVAMDVEETTPGEWHLTGLLLATEDASEGSGA